MTNRFLKDRFTKIQEKLEKANLGGALISGKPNQVYFLGFTSASPMALFIPAADQNIAPIIVTNPLEEEIVRDSCPLSEVEVKVIMKDIHPGIQKAVEAKKYWTMPILGKETIVPHTVLTESVGKYYQSYLSSHTDAIQLDLAFPEQTPTQIMEKKLASFEYTVGEWDGQPIIHPRVSGNKFLLEYLKKASINSLGVEYQQISYADYQNLIHTYKHLMKKPLITVDIGAMVLNQRLIKFDDEIQKMKEAAVIGSKGFAAAEKAIHEFKTENQAQAEAEYAMKLAGATKPSFETIVVSGENSAYPHGHASDKKIKKGDLVTVDIGAVYNGYNSDMTRTIFAGNEAPAEALKIFKLVNQAHAIGLSHVKPGVKWGQPDLAVRNFFKEHDVLQYYNHSLGHGVGVEVHEVPQISFRMMNQDKVLKEGMVLTIEPGLYIPGTGGARTEDTVVVTADGYDLITKYSYTHYN